MDVLVDIIDPRHRNKVMVLAVRRALAGELDLVGTFEMVDLPTVFLSDEMTSICSLICDVSAMSHLPVLMR